MEIIERICYKENQIIDFILFYLTIMSMRMIKNLR